jgi:hypothetical protein
MLPFGGRIWQVQIRKNDGNKHPSLFLQSVNGAK